MGLVRVVGGGGVLFAWEEELDRDYYAKLDNFFFCRIMLLTGGHGDLTKIMSIQVPQVQIKGSFHII